MTSLWIHSLYFASSLQQLTTSKIYGGVKESARMTRIVGLYDQNLVSSDSRPVAVSNVNEAVSVAQPSSRGLPRSRCWRSEIVCLKKLGCHRRTLLLIFELLALVLDGSFANALSLGSSKELCCKRWVRAEICQKRKLLILKILHGGPRKKRLSPLPVERNLQQKLWNKLGCFGAPA